jgi:hypothetical protein
MSLGRVILVLSIHVTHEQPSAQPGIEPAACRRD